MRVRALAIGLLLAACGGGPEPVPIAPPLAPAAGPARELLSLLALSGEQIPADWAPFQFDKVPRRTDYDVVTDAGAPVLRARADDAASALRCEREIDPARWPGIEWRWKVAAPVAGGDIRSKQTDDCAARVMLLYKYQPDKVSMLERMTFAGLLYQHGRYPPYRMLCYAWVADEAPDRIVASPYSDRVRVVPLRRGPAEAGRWVEERRDHLADYRAAFGVDPGPIEAVALMTDADDTGGSAVAWYGDLRLLGPLP